LVKLVEFTDILNLIEKVEAQAPKLSANERELFAHLKAKYAEPVTGSFDDKTCLEVILRNIEIREGYRLDPGDVAARRIDLERK
jgi:hypothetical protein